MRTEIDGLGDPRGTASRAGARVTPWSASFVSFLPKQERHPPEALFKFVIRKIKDKS